jgi:hypothetical protein
MRHDAYSSTSRRGCIKKKSMNASCYSNAWIQCYFDLPSDLGVRKYRSSKIQVMSSWVVVVVEREHE